MVEMWRWQGAAARKADDPAGQPLGFAALEGWHQADCRAAYLNLTGRPAATRRDARRYFEHAYAPCLLPGSDSALITAYFEPRLAASARRTAASPVPLLARPADLRVLADDDPRRADGLTALRSDGAPYPTRAEIEAGALGAAARALAWLADPVDAFIAHVQGSVCLDMDDGRALRLTFDGKNGHPYTSIGRRLSARGAVPATAGLAEISAWLRADPQRGAAAMAENASYIFFRALDGDGPIGSTGTPLVPGLSLAVDPALFALHAPVWIDAPTLRGDDGQPFRRLMLAHDTGSAIKGSARADVFWGAGTAAGEAAGLVRHMGRLVAFTPVRA